MGRMIAIITGASSGIGWEMAKILGKDYDIVMVARNEDRLLECSRQLRELLPSERSVEIFPCDVSNPSACRALHNKYTDAPVEILVNAAGFGCFGEFAETDLERDISMMDTNMKGLHILMKLFLRDMIRRRSGYILNVASSAAYMPGSPLMAAYYASKAYVLSLTRSVAAERSVREAGIYVGALCPGPVDTAFHKTAGIHGNPGGMSAEKCARIAVRGMFSKKTLIIPGFLIKLTYLGAKLLPASFLLWFAGKHQQHKEH